MKTVSATAEPATPSAETFADLVLSVGRNRDREAFLKLFHHFAPRLKSFLMKGGTSPEQAEELVQETMLTVWNRAVDFDPARANASTWIFTIARNKRIDALRKAGRGGKRIGVDISDAAYIADESAPESDRQAIDSQTTSRIADALKTLPPEQSDLVYKAYFEDKTHSEIAAETRLPLGTVKSRLRLAMDRLRPHLQKDML